METETMKVEMESETCCVCGAAGEDLLLPEEYDATASARALPLRAVLLHLNHTKTVPSGRLCQSCITKALDAYSFSTQLASKGPPSLSEKIKALRKRLHELTQKIDVFIVVGGGTDGAYTEEDIIMVERGASDPDDEAALEDPVGLRAKTLRGEPAYHCTVCPDTFQSPAELRRHEAACPARPARCPECGAELPSRAALRAHAARHPAVCALCLQRFPAPALRRAHQLLHHLDRRFVCGYDGCILRFSARSQLVSHIRKSHAGAPPSPPPAPAAPPAPCQDCGRTFASVAALRRHARVHRTRAAGQEDAEWHASEEEYMEVEALEDLDDHL